MELKELFEDALMKIYQENKIPYNYSVREKIIEKKDISDLFVHSGAESVDTMFEMGFTPEEVSFQNDVLKGEGKSSIYDYVSKILSKTKNDTYTKKDYNLIALSFFTLGVDKVLKENMKDGLYNK
jgi:hypothetical protein